MKRIKKISVSDLPENEGKIIDSFNTSDDKHTNAPSLYATNNQIEAKIMEDNTYSTEERVVGTWLDGRPVYKKTLQFNNVDISKDVNIAHNIQNIDKIVSAKSCFMNNNKSYFNGMSDSDGYLLLNINRTNINFYGTTYFAASTARYLYVTMEYTKTTD